MTQFGTLIQLAEDVLIRALPAVWLLISNVTFMAPQLKQCQTLMLVGSSDTLAPHGVEMKIEKERSTAEGTEA